MIGWIVITLFILGCLLFGWGTYMSDNGPGSADERLGYIIPSLMGIGMVIISVLIALGAGLWNLF